MLWWCVPNVASLHGDHPPRHLGPSDADPAHRCAALRRTPYRLASLRGSDRRRCARQHVLRRASCSLCVLRWHRRFLRDVKCDVDGRQGGSRRCARVRALAPLAYKETRAATCPPCASAHRRDCLHGVGRCVCACVSVRCELGLHSPHLTSPTRLRPCRGRMRRARPAPARPGPACALPGPSECPGAGACRTSALLRRSGRHLCVCVSQQESVFSSACHLLDPSIMINLWLNPCSTAPSMSLVVSVCAPSSCRVVRMVTCVDSSLSVPVPRRCGHA